LTVSPPAHPAGEAHFIVSLSMKYAGIYLTGALSTSKLDFSSPLSELWYVEATYVNLHLTVFKPFVIFENFSPLSQISVPPSILPDLGLISSKTGF
jgi:hypothetical protein